MQFGAGRDAMHRASTFMEFICRQTVNSSERVASNSVGQRPATGTAPHAPSPEGQCH
jgi:hypothetical protein